MKSIRAIACAAATALAVVVLTLGLFGQPAAAQSTDYTPSSIQGNNQGQGGVGGNVATTGSDSTIPLTALGIGLVSVGGLAIAVARRRRIASAAA